MCFTCGRTTVTVHEGECVLARLYDSHDWAQMNPCDKRRSVSEAKLQFPGVDFALIESDEDVLWKEDVRETTQERQVPPPFSY